MSTSIVEDVGVGNTRQRVLSLYGSAQWLMLADQCWHWRAGDSDGDAAAADRQGRAMRRVVIVDDEQEARCSLTVLLAREPNMVLVGECGSAREALSMLQSATPGLVFLDIDMPECDGFAWLERVGPAPAFAVASVTVHHQFALRAFEARAGAVAGACRHAALFGQARQRDEGGEIRRD